MRLILCILMACLLLIAGCVSATHYEFEATVTDIEVNLEGGWGKYPHAIIHFDNGKLVVVKPSYLAVISIGKRYYIEYYFNPHSDVPTIEKLEER